VFWLCRGYFSGWPSALTTACFVWSLLLAFVIGFLFETLIGLTAFWLLEISSFNFVFITVIYVTSGHMFPLDLAPEPWATILKATPFQYLAYFPSILFLHGDSWTTWELLRAMLLETATAVGLAAFVVWVYRRGLQRYSAFGG
jgi:ABC-2 type transport system permease protein